jgi:hypothetical protein
LERVALPHREILAIPDGPIEFVFFIEKGLASTIAEPAPDAHVEVGMTGCEGMVGIPVVLGTDRAPHRVVAQGPGEALRVAADDLRRIFVARPPVQARYFCMSKLSWFRSARQRRPTPALPLASVSLAGS